MSDIWEKFQEKYDNISLELTQPDIHNEKRLKLQKELAFLSSILTKYKEFKKIEEQFNEVKKQSENNKDEQMAELFEEEITLLEKKCQKEKKMLENLLYPRDKKDKKSAFLEIRSGAGGKEATLFAAELMQMYCNYALKKGWKVSVVSCSPTDLGGIKEAVIYIKGKDVYGYLKYEAGVHRVQRVPETETAGRIHTSTATVAVLAEAEELDLKISPDDLKIDVYRASGAGGQHVNTTDSAVRITHIPTGVVVACQDERSQHKNKAKAMKVLTSKLVTAQEEKAEAERSKQRKEMVGFGMRAEKVRTYNFPQNRVTDHQVNLTIKSLDRFIEGDLDQIIDALVQKDIEDRKKKSIQKII